MYSFVIKSELRADRESKLGKMVCIKSGRGGFGAL